jgi:hypothetical protein
MFPYGFEKYSLEQIGVYVEVGALAVEFVGLRC